MSNCIWCGGTADTADHVFPRSLGSTREVSVPACRSCQTDISAAEQRVARSSLLGLQRLNLGPVPRTRSRPESGSVEPEFIFVKDPVLGGYNEVAIQAGGCQRTLPSIEVHPETNHARRKASSPEEAERLAEAVRDLFRSPAAEQGVVVETHVSLVDPESVACAGDPDWWPRMLLDLRGRLCIRARSPEEAIYVARAVFALVHDPRWSDYSHWRNGEIAAGTPHVFSLIEDSVAIARVVAKICYGLVRWSLGGRSLSSEGLEAVRSFVRNPASHLPTWFSEVSGVGSFDVWLHHHVAVVHDQPGALIGLVCLYGACFEVRLGHTPEALVSSLPLVVISARDGTKTEQVIGTTADHIKAQLYAHVSAVQNCT